MMATTNHDKAETVSFATGTLILGTILVASSGSGVVAILIGDDPDILVRDLRHRLPTAHLVRDDAACRTVVTQVSAFVETPQSGWTLPLDLRGTAFQQRVWQALRGIQAGATATYTDIANRIGAPGAVRAVARACSANPVAVAIPCHRVIRRDGALSGYRWGADRKRALLAREARA
jgi:AraC family transcriptional regulator of adaptative response/methylated-DNA-[protein]-cysteine methyltransferase